MPRLDGKAALIAGDEGGAAYPAPKGSVRSLAKHAVQGFTKDGIRFHSIPRTDLRGHGPSGAPGRCALPIAGHEEAARLPADRRCHGKSRESLAIGSGWRSSPMACPSPALRMAGLGRGIGLQGAS